MSTLEGGVTRKGSAFSGPESPAVGAGGRPQRADARTNRVRVLDAAEEVFGRGGESASTEEVARLAGVGIATVFRNFPTKAALLEAVLVRRFLRLRDQATELVSAADPGLAFFDFFAHMVADAAGKIAIAEALADAGGDAPSSATRASDELKRAVGVLLERAQEVGAVRTDVGLPEVYALLIGASRAAVLAHLDEDVRSRALAIVFDGLADPPRRAQS
jgi:AcrR family transcriptional regulator